MSVGVAPGRTAAAALLAAFVWAAPAHSHAQEAAARDELCGLLSDAVRTRLMSDVPIGTFLSGGVDSSCVTALAQRQGR